MRITVNLSKEFREALKLLEGYPNKAERVMRSVANRVLDGIKTDAGQLTSRQYLVPSSVVKKTFQFRRAGVVPALVSRGTRKSLADYSVKPNRVIRGKPRANLQGAVKRGGLKSLGPAFLVRRGSKWRPYVRTGSGRYAGLEPLISPAIPQLVGNDEILAEIERKAVERFQKRFTHELGRLQS